MGVAGVSGRGDPFQVRRAIVDLDAIDVIHLLAGDGWPGEGGEYEAVNAEPYGLTLTAEANLEIAPVVQPRLENIANIGIGGLPHTSHPSEIGDLVETLVAKDGLPGFKGGCARLGVHRKTPFGATWPDGQHRRGHTYYTTR
jgi:hypothetical protein